MRSEAMVGIDGLTGPIKEELAQSLFDHIPVGVGSKGTPRSRHHAPFLLY